MSHVIESPERVFPLSRHLSCRLSRALVGLPITPNQITATALAPGLASAWCFAAGGYVLGVAGALLLMVYYVLDNADGEIARMKDQCSVFGDRFDTFADWIVHTAFFAALGIGTAGTTGQEAWLWLGWIAAAGGTINYIIKIVSEARAKRAGSAADAEPNGGKAEAQPRWSETKKGWFVFAFRMLARTDFCFIVLVLAVIDATWVLLPAGAVGAQVYWAIQFTR